MDADYFEPKSSRPIQKSTGRREVFPPTVFSGEDLVRAHHARRTTLGYRCRYIPIQAAIARIVRSMVYGCIIAREIDLLDIRNGNRLGTTTECIGIAAIRVVYGRIRRGGIIIKGHEVVAAAAIDRNIAGCPGDIEVVGTAAARGLEIAIAKIDRVRAIAGVNRGIASLGIDKFAAAPAEDRIVSAEELN